MVYFSEQFLEARSNKIEYNGSMIHRFFRFDKPGEYIFRFMFISSNSKLNQAIVIFYGNLIGKIVLEDKDVSKDKNVFSRIAFYEDTAPKQFDLKIKVDGGYLTICNGSDSDGTKCFCHTLSFGCAMKVEEIGENHFKFYCNDYENDDDFDDLIFELEIDRL